MASGLYFIAFVCLSSGLWIGADGKQDLDECCCKKCPPGLTKIGNNCYLYQSAAKDWTDAEVSCVSVGGNLASVHNKVQYDGIRSLIKKATGKDARTWIGGSDSMKEGVWLWSDGSKFAFKFWGPHEPNNAQKKEHCLELNFKASKGRMPKLHVEEMKSLPRLSELEHPLDPTVTAVYQVLGLGGYGGCELANIPPMDETLAAHKA
uniref:galactose-specific lectin nattectin-like n=1 Tax=Semicossyphus pulcher TaxID=241346 RepID=UPI0037E93347